MSHDATLRSAALLLRKGHPPDVLVGALDDRGALLRLAHAAALRAWVIPVDAEDLPCGRCGHLRSSHRMVFGGDWARLGRGACCGAPVLTELDGGLAIASGGTCACGAYDGPGAAPPPCRTCGLRGCSNPAHEPAVAPRSTP